MNSVYRTLMCLLPMIIMVQSSCAQSVVNSKYGQSDKFRQLTEVLPTPNSVRTASGAPGHKYWQQKVDYDINVTLDDERQRISGQETITYHNNSPDTLKYLWLQLDANRFRPDSNSNRHQSAKIDDRMTFDRLGATLYARQFKGGCLIRSVANAVNGTKLPYRVVGTHMRVDLPEALKPDSVFRFIVSWKYNIPDATLIRTRGGFEFFEDDGNYIYEIAQWFPRLCAYSDSAGWQHKEFLGRGEFALEFGDYIVRITVPDDHIVGATGELLNSEEVLTQQQRERLEQARTADAPVFIVTPEEAKVNETELGTGSRTWIYSAKNVRDFAFASSRKFIWDAWGHNIVGNTVMAMSLYPNEGEPLWSTYSTHAIVHTLEVYSKYSFPYPYPVAYSINGPVYGMEYPMICFNGPRPEKDGTYSARTKYGLISVIIHEVGHNYFPMIVNSDERQWTWMDEGINTFLQYLSEVEWQDRYPSRRGEPKDIVSYMTSQNQVPIMTNSESILQFGNNAYSKPATALNILRESVLGRELFDFAFREFSQRWMFKRPNPADLFRTMEDASGVDLDWFWRGWFYTTDHVDIAVTNVRRFNIDTGNPRQNSRLQKEERKAEPDTLSRQRNTALTQRTDRYPDLLDFYNTFDELGFTKEEQKKYKKMVSDLEPRNRKLLKNSWNFYLVDLENRGGLVMPVVLRLKYKDDTTEELRLPAEIWVRNSKKVSRLVVSEREIASVQLDPHLESADTDLSNNMYPPEIVKSRFQLYKEKKAKNEMRKAGLGTSNDRGTDTEDNSSDEEDADS
ncbi:MAG: M1 family metallopeptidase [Fuerstiella sp.]|nr:M1 family metallopeptidase [Fuerstiella sp.]